MDAATRNLQQFYQLKLELLKAVDEISRFCEEGGLEDKVLTDRVLDLMHQTVHSARLTVHYITALGDKSVNITHLSAHTSEADDNRHNKVLRKRASSSPVMRREGPNGVGSSPSRSPKNWHKVSKISAFNDSSIGCDSSIDVGRREMSAEDENSNHSSNSSRRKFSHDDSNFVDEEVVSKFVEPCLPCSRSSSRAADTSSFLEASVSSIDTSNVSVRRKRKKKDDSAESSIEDLLPETLPPLHSDSLSLAVLGCSSPATPNHQLTFCQRSASPLQLTSSLCQRTASPLHLSSVVCSRMTSPAGQLTPPASESGQGSPKSVDSEKLEADAIIPTDGASMCSEDVTTSTLATENNTDVFTSSQLNLSQQSQSAVISYRPYLPNGCTSSINPATADYGRNNVDNTTSTDITAQIERLSQVKSRDKKSSSSPKKVSAGRRNSARISSGSRSSPRKPVPRIEVISIDCSSDEEMFEEEEFIIPQTKCIDKVEEIETPTKFEESGEILPGTKQSQQRIQSSSKKEHLNFKDVCQINESMFDTPELLRGAESWKDWRINSPVEGTRNLNTPLECSTPLSIRSDKMIDELESKSDDDSKKNVFLIKEVVMRQPNLRITPARIKYSSKIKEINQDKGRKLIVLSDTRLKDNFDSKDNSEDSQEEEEVPKQKKHQNKIRNNIMSDSNLTKLTVIPKPESINRADTPLKKKTLARSKASVSLVKPVESPPSTPKRRGRPDKQISVTSVVSKIPVIDEEDDSVNPIAKDHSNVITTTAKYKVPDFKNPFCNLRRNVSRSRSGLQRTKDKHTSSSIDIKAKSSDRPKLIRASASVAKISVPSKARNGCTAVSNNDNVVPVISTKLIKTMADIFEKQSDSAPSRTEDDDKATKDTEAAIGDKDKHRTTKVVFSETVDVFYFKRIQGWLSVPKEGGNTLGMEYFHHSKDKVKLSPEHDNHDNPETLALFEPDELESSAALNLARRNKFPRIENMCDRELGVDVENDGIDHFNGGANYDEYDDYTLSTATRGKKIRTPVRSDSTPCLLEPSKLNGSRASGTAAAVAATGSLLDLRAAVVSINNNKKGECGTRGLYRISSRARKTLLKKDGIKELDTMEALETKFLRESRMEVGCSCSGECKPGVCECVEAGIQCQEERSGFPCSCSVGCTNPAGIKRFDPTAVKMHLIQTMLEIQGALDIK